jgi:hypothetical protein
MDHRGRTASTTNQKEMLVGAVGIETIPIGIGHMKIVLVDGMGLRPYL